MEKSRSYYQNLIKTKRDYRAIVTNILYSFTVGGTLSLAGQLIFRLLNNKLDETTSYTIVSMILVTITAILTAIGSYDKLGQYAKAGLWLPISGFSNSCVSAAMEYKNEGIVLGVSANVLKLAGSVIVFGVFSAITIGIIYYIVGVFI